MGPRSRWGRTAAVTALVLLVLTAAVLTGLTSVSSQRSAQPSSQPGASPATPGLATKINPAIVDVYTLLGFQKGAAAGTGMVLTPSGEVLTNNHVVEGATSVRVTDLGDGRNYNATVLGTDKTNDVAVLQISDASGLATVQTGDSSRLRVGDAVTAIGNAGGAGGSPSVTTGNVTALNQAIIASDEVDGTEEQLGGLVQTDAALQPGDSGGPLVDNAGHVVAVNTAASANYQLPSGPSASYAVPVNQALSIVRQIETGTGSSTVHIGPAAFLGVVVQTSRVTPGALVDNVESGSPAQRAGIVTGDVITSLSGQNVDSPTTLSSLIEGHHPGDTVTLGWTDSSGRPHSATAQLTTGPAS